MGYKEIMMKTILTITLIIAALITMGCAGKDKNPVDKTPPIPPVLIPHLKDTGDPPVIYNGQLIIINDENNGIDTVPDGDWIRIMWQAFVDTDLSIIRVYRFDEMNADPVLIDSIPASRISYVDNRAALRYRVKYSYFIDLVDLAGNSSRSDTVSYAILPKPILVSPDNFAQVSPTNVVFQWNQTGATGFYRALVLDNNREYVWHGDFYQSTEQDPLEIRFPVNLATEYSGQSLYWRIDSFEYDFETDMFIGGESIERVLFIQ